MQESINVKSRTVKGRTSLVYERIVDFEKSEIDRMIMTIKSRKAQIEEHIKRLGTELQNANKELELLENIER